MKKLTLLLLCVIFGITNAQYKESLVTKTSIDEKIEKAKDFSAENPQKSLDLSIQIYTESKKIRYKKGMLESIVIRMSGYYDMGDSKKVIDLTFEAEKLGNELQDTERLCNVKRLKAQAYDQLGFFEKSGKEFEKSMIKANEISSENLKNYNKALIYMGIASLKAHANAPIDSVINYQKKTLEAANNIDNDKEYLNKKYHLLAMSYINLGMTNAALNNIQSSEEYFTKALDICRNKNYVVGKRIEVLALNEFAWLYHSQKKYEKVKEYAKQAEIIEKQINLPYIRRDIYEVLFKSYIETGEKTAASKYTQLFTSLNDSIVNSEKIAVSTPIEHIVREEKEVHKNNTQKLLVIIIAIIFIIAVLTWGLWKRNQKKLQKKHKTILENLKNESLKKNIPANEKTIVIADETLNDLLLKLKKFEDSKKFLRKDMNLTYLANSLNTNTRYLSEIINQHKGKNFYNYLNDLRIQYITDLLYNNPKYREYKVSYLAEVCGFTSREVFSVIFKKETGVTPSYFINSLRKDESEV